jgi:ATP-dependent Clp protease ATP-binding subunit ClpA
MPFINDVLEANHHRNEAAKAQQAVPAGRSSRYLFDPDQVFADLSAKIIGQTGPLSAIHDLLHVVKADLSNGQRPLSVMLFVGSTGVGKTETVRALAEFIQGGREYLCRIDMNTLAQEHYAASLTGAPPGYVGSKEGHTLFDADKIAGSYSRPGIVLFDELEKANHVVIRALLNVCDSGMLTLSAGTQSLSFRNAMIFMTSNIGARELAAYRQRFTKGWRKLFKRKPSPEAEEAILQKALESCFDPEFINRLDRIVYFSELDDHSLKELIAIELAQLNKRLAKHAVSVSLDAAAETYFKSQYDARYGARNIQRIFRKELEPIVARRLNQSAVVNQLRIGYKNGTLQALE